MAGTRCASSPTSPGVFGRVLLARVDLEGQDGPAVVDLNPHLDYTVSTLPQTERDLSLGDPRAILWSAAGERGYVAGMGSNNVIAIDAAGRRLGAPIEVGEGPTGLALDEQAGRLYVLNKFESSISVVDTAAGHEIGRLDFFDPEPAAIKAGRVHLYGTHENSGLGPGRLRDLPRRRALRPPGLGPRRSERRSGRPAGPEQGHGPQRPERRLRPAPPHEGADDDADAAGHHRQGAAALARRPRRPGGVQRRLHRPAGRRHEPHGGGDAGVRGLPGHDPLPTQPLPQPRQHAAQRPPAAGALLRRPLRSGRARRCRTATHSAGSRSTGRRASSTTRWPA